MFACSKLRGEKGSYCGGLPIAENGREGGGGGGNRTLHC